jgi:4-amino-4-deoxy-L-arabinose transferase-like glycosyltransferase
MNAPDLRRMIWPELLIVAFAAVLFFGRIHLPLLEPEETRYAEIPRQMLHHGSVVVPWRNGQVYLDKPPLLYWLVMGNYTTFGIHGWAARTATVMTAFLTVVVVYVWGRAVAGRLSGQASAVMLLLSGDFVYRSPMLTMNSLLGLFVALSLAIGHVALLGRRLHFGWWALSAGSCGLGVLAKGPVAVVLVVPCLFALHWIDRTTVRPGFASWFVFAAVLLGVAGPWFVAVAIKCPDFIQYFFWFHHVERYVRPFDHAKPWWAYLPQVVIGLTPCLAVLMVRGWQTWFRLPPAALFATIAAGWGLVFFSTSGSKRPVYLVPIEPLLVVGAGIALVGFGAVSWRWKLAGGLTATIMAIGVFVWLPWYSAQYTTADVIRSVDTESCDSSTPVICCLSDSDAVGFYLNRDEVVSIPSHDPAELAQRIGSARRAIVFTRNDTDGRKLLVAMSIDWQWHPTAENKYLIGGYFTRK